MVSQMLFLYIKKKIILRKLFCTLKWKYEKPQKLTDKNGYLKISIT